MHMIRTGVLIVGARHLGLGLKADALLGIEVASAVAADAGLSSQNRFFGVAYTLFAVVFWQAAARPVAYRGLLRAALIITFVAGLARLVPWWAFGAPPMPVVALLLVELLVPPVLLTWQARLLR